MKKVVLAGTILAASFLFAQQAQAQCGSGFGLSICGQIYVNTPTVTVQPPVVYAPPPVIYTPPPQPVYVTRPAPVIVTQPAPVVVQTTRVVTAPVPRLQFPRRDFVRHRGLGIGARAGAGYAGVSEITNFGGGGVLRYIASPRFGLEVTVDVYGGSGYEGYVDRVEFPVTVNGLWFINPRHRVQLYALAGLGVSFASIEDSRGNTDSPVYGGGELGIGVEFLLGQHIGLTLDVRGFIRGRMNDREFQPGYDTAELTDGTCRVGDSGSWECTDLEAGATFNAGFNFYL